MDGDYEYAKGYLQEEKYEVTEIKIRRGNGQVDMENMVLTIPSHEELRLIITAQNTYIGEDYQGEMIIFRLEAPETRFFIIE